MPERDWEADTELPQEAVDNNCKDIAKQLVEDNDIDVSAALMKELRAGGLAHW